MSGDSMEMTTTMNASAPLSFCQSSNISDFGLSNASHWIVNRKVGATIAGVLILIFFIIGTIWNLFIIITFIVKHHLLKEPANIFLLNVAITDLLICLTTMLFTFITAFAQEFKFGDNDQTRCGVCEASGFFLIFLIYVSLHLLMALSIDRFILLSRPLRYKRLMNRWKAILICVILYAICFVLAVLPLVGFGAYEFNGRFAACVPRFTPSKNRNYIIVLVAEALIPIVAIGITNVWTYRLVSKFLKRNFRRRSTFRRRDLESSNKDGIGENQKHRNQQKQLVKVFSALFAANIISYTPTILAFILFLPLRDRLPGEIYIIGFICFMTAPVFHPILESFFVKELRYQVSRAKKGVRRVSTVIIRQTTQLFNSKTLDEANKNANQENENDTPRPKKRSIRFLDGRRVELDASMVTEMDEVHVHSSSSEGRRSPEDAEAGEGQQGHSPSSSPQKEGSNDDTTDSKTKKERNIVMLSKVRRTVTFQETSVNKIDSLPRTLSTPNTRSSADSRNKTNGVTRDITIDVHESSEEVPRDNGVVLDPVEVVVEPSENQTLPASLQRITDSPPHKNRTLNPDGRDVINGGGFHNLSPRKGTLSSIEDLSSDYGTDV